MNWEKVSVRLRIIFPSSSLVDVIMTSKYTSNAFPLCINNNGTIRTTAGIHGLEDVIKKGGDGRIIVELE